ncbi:MAG: deoxynucleoside kinase [Bacteroidota bacterium]
MERYLLKKNLTRLIIIEGLWGSGKTTFANYLANKYSLIFIKEPIHRNLFKERGISNWYFHQHINRQIQARNINSKKKVIMERSIISNAAYQYAKIGCLYRQYHKILLQFPELHFSTIVFLYNNSPLLEFKSRQSSNNFKINQYLSKKFVKRYIEFYQSVLPKIIKNHPIFLKTKKNGKFLTINNIFTNFKKEYTSLIGNKKKQ